MTPFEERLFSRIDAAGPCWLWTGNIGPSGYGRVSNSDGRVLYAHRLVWELLVGLVPLGRDLDHVCRNRVCVNPDHLEPVTRAENVARGAARRGMPRRTRCPSGHELTPENTRCWRNQRNCRTCARAADRRYRERQRAARQQPVNP